MNNKKLLLFAEINIFYQQLMIGDLDHSLLLAKSLEKLADQAWDIVDEMYQSAIRIDA